MSALGAPEGLAALRVLAPRFPTAEAAIVEIAYLEAQLDLPKGTVHVVSDVHGEHEKLQHVVHNGSGSLRPLVDRLFAGRLTREEKDQLLNTIYYPAQVFQHLGLEAADRRRRGDFVRVTIRRQFEILVAFSRQRSLKTLAEIYPTEYETLFHELFMESLSGDRRPFVDAMLGALTARGWDLQAVRWASRVIRHLSVEELVVAGDLGDRGPRLDKVIDILARQTQVAITWGNHDVSWMGACLGQEALIATVLRISLRYRRLSQLEEGYGISIRPLEKLAREVYGDDPAERFRSRGDGVHEADLLARMQKAISVIQFKLEAQIIGRHPEFAMDDRALIRRLDLRRGTLELDGRRHPLRDHYFPTLAPHDGAALSPAEAACMRCLKHSFLRSAKLWEQMSFLVSHGRSYLVRDGNVIFHGCLPVDESGAFLPLEIDGSPRRGRELMDTIDRVVSRAFREKRSEDLDLLWYLWCGPRSPMFGKDKMTTVERYLVTDAHAHDERKNPYFRLIHTLEFCRRILDEFGVGPDRGLIVNGHVPVRVEKGETPLKDAQLAITIDGAFSEAYGDRGYTLILACDGVHLAEHSHFQSVGDALTTGADIVPRVTEIRVCDPPRRIADTERGETIRSEIAMLERLAEAYRDNTLRESRG